MFYNYSGIGFQGLLLFGAFIFVGIYGYTTLMDEKRYGVWIEVIRALAGWTVLSFTGDWFGIESYWENGPLLVGIYFGITLVGAFYFGFVEKRPGRSPVVS
jgi:hypothetical protein